MNKPKAFGVIIFFVVALTAFGAGGSGSNVFSPYVNEAGKIRVPQNYRTEWVFLGTWSIANDKEDGGAAGFHYVYTQLGTIEAYRKTGKFPDGAVLLKELLKTKTGLLTTGNVSWGNEVEGWFVMVKDNKGRFKGNPLWGDGWGWALFNADNSMETVTTDYKTECIPCHLPVRQNDWVYTYGYPALRINR